jgi:hypothetical protein
VSLDRIRAAIDSAPGTDTATAARQIRNAVARAVVEAALTQEQPAPPGHPPPVQGLRERVGPELADELVAIYAGGPGWTSRAIDVLEPLHALARASAT